MWQDDVVRHLIQSYTLLHTSAKTPYCTYRMRSTQEKATKNNSVTCSFLVGMVVFLGMRVVMTPPAVSNPRDSGVTSSNSRSCTLLCVSPLRIAACSLACLKKFQDINAKIYLLPERRTILTITLRKGSHTRHALGRHSLRDPLYTNLHEINTYDPLFKRTAREQKPNYTRHGQTLNGGTVLQKVTIPPTQYKKDSKGCLT